MSKAKGHSFLNVEFNVVITGIYPKNALCKEEHEYIPSGPAYVLRKFSTYLVNYVNPWRDIYKDLAYTYTSK